MIETWLDNFRQKLNNPSELIAYRPLITLSYAQSIDGSLTHKLGEPLLLSHPMSMKLTHRLREMHNGILVGIGTILADDPQLTARFGAISQPIPIILDRQIRIPQSARVLNHPVHRTIVSHLEGLVAPPELAERVRLISLPHGLSAEAELSYLLSDLKRLGINHIMVEGGIRIIQAFWKARLVDNVIITIAPKIVCGETLGSFGGNKAIHSLNIDQAFMLGPDLIIYAQPVF